jgi:hypothetical protein
LYGCVTPDQYCLTCVRGLSQAEVLSRLAVTDREPYPRCTGDEAVERFGIEVPAVRVCRSGDWTFLLDVDPHGRTFRPPVLTRPSPALLMPQPAIRICTRT